VSDDDKKTADRLRKASEMITRMFEGFPAHQRGRIMQSHFLQSPEEKKARLKLVQELSLELAEVKKQQRFTLFGETAMEAVIEGDWKKVADVMGWLSFSREPLESMREQAPSWARFRELLRLGCVEARYRDELAYRESTGQKENN
jgi:hypothetical protein